MRWAWLTRRAGGVAALLVGLVLLTTPFLVGEWAIALLGALLVVLGGIEGAQAVSGPRRGDPWGYVPAVVTVLAGLLVWVSPSLVLSGLLTLLAILLAAEGASLIATALRREHGAARWWTLLNGVVDLGLAALVWSQRSELGITAVGVILGIYVLSEGWRMLLAPLGGGEDFTFLVIGDTGEGDPSQASLRDRYLDIGRRPDVKFLVVSSDVIYPAGEMKDYELNFYLPFKGFEKPIYAIPGNHDWFNALDGFVANFFTPDAARVAMRARVDADYGFSSTTDDVVEALIERGAFLRAQYGVYTGLQRGPFFELHGARFSLVAVDTGILRQIDARQDAWLRAALGRARGNFTMVILGHPLFAGGERQDTAPSFAAIREVVREAGVPVVMAGDTHDFEYYRETYDADGAARVMQHFVNGGGGAYLSIGTALAWPARPPVADWAFYPRTDALEAKLAVETPLWKWPFLVWLRRLDGWPVSVETLSGAFDFNRAPFFQSFMEVRVEGSRNQVRFVLQGVHGPLRWRDLQIGGQVVPVGQGPDDAAEWTLPMSGGHP